MTEQEQLNKMRLVILNDITDTEHDEEFKIYLQDALTVLLNTLFPFDETQTSIDETNFRLRSWQVRCAIELYNNKDHNGVYAYSENGLNVTYLTTLVSTDLLRELNPKVGVPHDSSET